LFVVVCGVEGWKVERLKGEEQWVGDSEEELAAELRVRRPFRPVSGGVECWGGKRKGGRSGTIDR